MSKTSTKVIIDCDILGGISFLENMWVSSLLEHMLVFHNLVVKPRDIYNLLPGNVYIQYYKIKNVSNCSK